MNALNHFDKTVREYSVAPTDDLIRFWRSPVKVVSGAVHLLVKNCVVVRAAHIACSCLVLIFFAVFRQRQSVDKRKDYA